MQPAQPPRTVDYLRISITDRCNERCLYCMPEGFSDWKPREERSYLGTYSMGIGSPRAAYQRLASLPSRDVLLEELGLGEATSPDEADVIVFNIPGAGVKTINLLLALPEITDGVVIDAYGPIDHGDRRVDDRGRGTRQAFRRWSSPATA